MENIPTSRPFFSKQQTPSKKFYSEIINEIVLNSYHLILFLKVLTLLRKRHAKFVKNGGKIKKFHAFRSSFTEQIHIKDSFLLFVMMKSIDLHPTISVSCLFISTASMQIRKTNCSPLLIELWTPIWLIIHLNM
jgi:hypothetical protein